MNEARCDTIRELLPDYVGGRLPAPDSASVEAHLGACPDCRDEVALLRLLFTARPTAPPELAWRIGSAARGMRTRGRHPWWGVAAASVAAVALGIGVISRQAPQVEEVEVPEIVVGVEGTSLGVADDGLVAGAPALEGLSDDALQLLLDEMGSETTGGTA